MINDLTQLFIGREKGSFVCMAANEIAYNDVDVCVLEFCIDPYSK